MSGCLASSGAVQCPAAWSASTSARATAAESDAAAAATMAALAAAADAAASVTSEVASPSSSWVQAPEIHCKHAASHLRHIQESLIVYYHLDLRQGVVSNSVLQNMQARFISFKKSMRSLHASMSCDLSKHQLFRFRCSQPLINSSIRIPNLHAKTIIRRGGEKAIKRYSILHGQTNSLKDDQVGMNL